MSTLSTRTAPKKSASRGQSLRADPSPLHGRIDVDELIRRSYRRAHDLDDAALVNLLKHNLGRPMVARLTHTADPNTVSRWASGRVKPEAETRARMRTAASMLLALEELVGSLSSGADWLTGKNPSLSFEMPAIVLSEGRDAEVYHALREIAEW